MADLDTRERAARQVREIKAMLPAYNTKPRAAAVPFAGDNQTEAVVEGGWFGGIPGPRFWHRVGAGGAGIEEAPQDGRPYVRLNGQWVLLASAPSVIQEAPQDGRAYVRINGQWVLLSAAPGVTNGADAQPGQVGEFIRLASGFVAYPGAQFTTVTSLGALPAGDWDCWAFADVTGGVHDFQFNLDPVPAGFSNSMWCIMAGGALESNTLLAQPSRALTSASSPIAMQVTMNTLGTSAAGQFTIEFAARRRR